MADPCGRRGAWTAARFGQKLLGDNAVLKAQLAAANRQIAQLREELEALETFQINPPDGKEGGDG